MPKIEADRTSKVIKTTPYDVAEHLRTPEEIAAYLDAWLEEAPDDAAGIAKALGNIARAKGMTQVAKDAGLTPVSIIAWFMQASHWSRSAMPIGLPPVCSGM